MRIRSSASWRISSVRLLIGLLACWLWSSTNASAQTVPDVNNPSGVTFTCSADHALIDSYELDFRKPDGSLLQTINIGKPTPDAANTCAANVNVQPIAFANGYTFRARAKAGTAVSDDTVSINKFNRVPGSPSKLQAK